MKALALCAVATSLLAVTSAAAETERAMDNDIVVTAQKRAESAQKIPVSLYTITGATIERQGISSVQELGNAIAGVTIAASNPGAMRMTIRGASDLSSSNQASSVNGLYLDETVMSYVPGYMPEVSLLDIERIELLRGPQGTLFGDGSEGGTLRIITRKPETTQFFGRAKVGAYATEGGGSGYGAQINANIPLVKDLFAVTVAGAYRDLPGWIDVPDIGVKDSNRSKLSDGRIAARYSPNSRLNIDMFYQFGRSDIFDFISTQRDVLNPRKAAAALGINGVGSVGGLSPSEGRLDIGALTIGWDLDFATLVSSTALTEATYDTTRDLTSALPLAFPPFMVPSAKAQSIYNISSNALTQELRLVSVPKSRLKWTVGVYFKHEQRTVEDGFVFNVPAIAAVDHPLSHSDQEGDSWAVFADLDYPISNRWSVQAGLRYFADDKAFSVKQLTGSMFPLGFPPADTLQSGDDHSNATSPKFGITYAPSPKAVVFAKYSKGFRGGGANTAPLGIYPYATKQFGPDALGSYEVGLKSTIFTDWQFNIYGYHNDWSDLQLPFRTYDGVFTYVRNAGDASGDGFEAELNGNITNDLNIMMSYAYNKSVISGDVTDAGGSLIAKSENDLPLNSNNKFTTAVHYQRYIASNYQLMLDGRYRWASKNFSDPGNSPTFENDETSQLYLSAGLSGPFGVLTAYVDNLLDRADTVAKFPPAGPQIYTYANYLRPRNFGLEFRRDF